MASASRKRALREVGDSNSIPPSKRQEIEPKSPKTATRDACEALIGAIKKAEDSIEASRAQDQAPKATPRKSAKASSAKTIDFEFDKDKATGLPYIYIVVEKTSIDCGNDAEEAILSTFASLEGASNLAQSCSEKYSSQKGLDFTFSEDLSADGRISWQYEDENGFTIELRIEKCILNGRGSVPPHGTTVEPSSDEETESESTIEQ